MAYGEDVPPIDPEKAFMRGLPKEETKIDRFDECKCMTLELTFCISLTYVCIRMVVMFCVCYILEMNYPIICPNVQCLF